MTDVFALAELGRQVRTDTRRLLAAARPEWLTWAPPGTSNHILWHAGHSVWLMDVLGIELLTGRSELPAGWAETFGMDCRPVAETRDWPDREQLGALLGRQLARFLELLATSPPNAAVTGRIIHGLHDEAKHQGEMYLLMKMCRAGATTV